MITMKSKNSYKISLEELAVKNKEVIAQQSGTSLSKLWHKCNF